jgi:hypothetical protein
LPSSDNLIIHDVNSEATARFAKENSNVQVAEDVRDVAEKSVSWLPFRISRSTKQIFYPSTPISRQGS